MALKLDGTNSKVIFLAGTANTTTLTSALTATPWTMTLPPTAGSAGQVLTTDGNGVLSWTTGGGGGGGSPGGATTQVQYNNAGAFAGSPAFTYDGSGRVSLGASATTTGILTLYNNVTAAALNIKAPTNSTNWTMTLPSGPGTLNQVLTTDGAGLTTWATVSSGAITVANDVTTNATRYPLYADITTGSLTTAYVASPEYTFNPSSGQLTAPHMESSSGIHLNSNTIAASYTLPPGMNGLSAGPMTIPGGVVVTAPGGQAWKVV